MKQNVYKWRTFCRLLLLSLWVGSKIPPSGQMISKFELMAEMLNAVFGGKKSQHTNIKTSSQLWNVASGPHRHWVSEIITLQYFTLLWQCFKFKFKYIHASWSGKRSSLYLTNTTGTLPPALTLIRSKKKKVFWAAPHEKCKIFDLFTASGFMFSIWAQKSSRGVIILQAVLGEATWCAKRCFGCWAEQVDFLGKVFCS